LRGKPVKRRDFVTLVGGAAAWPLAARAQQPERVRRIGVLMPFAKDDAEGQARVTAFLRELQRLGWTEGRNLQIEYRWETSDRDLRRAATELAALSPDVILVTTTQATAPMQQATQTVPIVFTQVADPVSAGFVDSLAKPGGNLTGFTNIEYNVGAKWLELLKEIVPSITHVGAIRDPSVTSSIGQFASIQSAAQTFGVEVIPLGGRNAKDIEHSVTEFAHGSNLGLITVATPLNLNNRDLIISLAARLRLPAIYPFRRFVTEGGLISYGPDPIDPHRLAAGYVDRVLKGENPANLPIQAATKFELAINLKTAKALGLTVPNSLLSRANELIE
jgi:putative tryptophan/tyrosine transport system substrate-binding protein